MANRVYVCADAYLYLGALRCTEGVVDPVSTTTVSKEGRKNVLAYFHDAAALEDARQIF